MDAGTESVRLAKLSGTGRSRGATSTCALTVVRGLAADLDVYRATLDLFRDENIEYAQKLMAAGVPCELSVYPGACHAFKG
ncbi:MAG: hypothetical protein CM15mP120_19180 [Pseudomonadota bacterium]|nr:MAG: hypothetical protein CM15mP120_19180 [Pseudomonadota bacterium]